MKYIILCGGIGKETTNYSLPKPLNLIQGRYMIEYIIDNIPSNEIFIIYNILLDEYNFQEILINKNEENLGIGGHVNKIIKLVKGEILVTAAGDDVSDKYRVEKLINALIIKLQINFA
jgi:NDP-sugar pyrophosphorylase family protein